MFFHVILGCQVHLAKCSNYLLWQLLNKALGVCLFSYLCCRCLRSWSGRLQMRAGLFLGGTQTSPDSMTRCVSVRFLYTCLEMHACVGKYSMRKISGLSETLFCDHLSMFADTVCDYQPIAVCMPPFVFECTVEMIRATQRSPLFPKSHQAGANEGNRSLVVSGNAVRKLKPCDDTLRGGRT